MAATNSGKVIFENNCQMTQQIPWGVKNFVETALSRTISKANMFSAETYDGCHKWWESDFLKKLPDDSADKLEVKNFIEITLSRTTSEINVFLHFMQKFKMAVTNGRKIFFLPKNSKLLYPTMFPR